MTDQAAGQRQGNGLQAVSKELQHTTQPLNLYLNMRAFQPNQLIAFEPFAFPPTVFGCWKLRSSAEA